MKKKVKLLILVLCLILIYPAVPTYAASSKQELHLNQRKLNLQVGNTYYLYLEDKSISLEDYPFGYYYDCLWESSDESVATVSNGYLTVQGAGSATITATYQNIRFQKMKSLQKHTLKKHYI